MDADTTIQNIPGLQPSVAQFSPRQPLRYQDGTPSRRWCMPPTEVVSKEASRLRRREAPDRSTAIPEGGEREVDALGVITISRVCFERCCSGVDVFVSVCVLLALMSSVCSSL